MTMTRCYTKDCYWCFDYVCTRQMIQVKDGRCRSFTSDEKAVKIKSSDFEDEEYIQCSRCGTKKISEEDIYCPICGIKFEAGESSES